MISAEEARKNSINSLIAITDSEIRDAVKKGNLRTQVRVPSRVNKTIAENYTSLGYDVVINIEAFTDEYSTLTISWGV